MRLSKEQRLKKLDPVEDENIDYSDIPELNEDFWANDVIEYPKKKNQDLMKKCNPGIHLQGQVSGVIRSLLNH